MTHRTGEEAAPTILAGGETAPTALAGEVIALAVAGEATSLVALAALAGDEEAAPEG